MVPVVVADEAVVAHAVEVLQDAVVANAHTEHNTLLLLKIFPAVASMFQSSPWTVHRTLHDLTFYFSWSQLKDIMRRAGEVCYVDAHNRMGRGRGEVCFGSREVMHKAKEELNGYDINGKRIEIIIKVCKLVPT